VTLLQIVSLSLTAILIENFIFVRFLGCCSFLGVSKQMDTALGMGLAVTFVMTMSSTVTYIVNNLLLKRLGLEYLRTLAFILVIAVLVQIVEMFLKKAVPALYQALGIYLPLITTNCAVLGAAEIGASRNYGFLPSVIYGLFAGVGFMLAILLFASVREKLEFADYPKSFEGFPIALVTAGLLAMCFIGFSGLTIGG